MCFIVLWFKIKHGTRQKRSGWIKPKETKNCKKRDQVLTGGALVCQIIDNVMSLPDSSQVKCNICDSCHNRQVLSIKSCWGLSVTKINKHWGWSLLFLLLQEVPEYHADRRKKKITGFCLVRYQFVTRLCFWTLTLSYLDSVINTQKRTWQLDHLVNNPYIPYSWPFSAKWAEKVWWQ